MIHTENFALRWPKAAALATAVTAAALATSAAHADTLLDTFAPDWQSHGQPWTVEKAPGYVQQLAVQVDVTAPVVITSMTVSLYTFHPELFGPAIFSLNLVPDVGGAPADDTSALYSAVMVNPVSALTTLDNLDIALAAGTYWLRGEQVSGSGSGVWQGGDSTAANWSTNFNGGGWQPYFRGALDAPGVRILTAVPEPGAWLLLVTGMAGLLPAMRRRRTEPVQAHS